MPPMFMSLGFSRAELPFVPLFLLWAVLILLAAALAPAGLLLWMILKVSGVKKSIFFSPALWLGLWKLLCSISGFEISVDSDKGAFSFKL
ncbi:MAG: hypothetical protein U5N86_11110 [Planctomycetota bacterium]|nr:hypothetical protein [Planctomycetota bacterium]